MSPRKPHAPRGTLVALVTPFEAATDTRAPVSRTALARLVEHCIGGGVDGLIPCGTTGESPTLSHDEHDRVIEWTLEAAAGRVPVYAGTGSNATDEAVRLTRHAAEAGADGILSVVPYYNKPGQRGLARHFLAVADAAASAGGEGGLPVILYDIPSRSGVGLELATLKELARHPNVCAIKEATGNVHRITRIRGETGLEVLSGDDALTLPMMALGAVGVVSVLANVLPDEVSALVRAASEGDFAAALALHERLHPAMEAMFVEPNPVPVKVALELSGSCSATVRLPLSPADDATVEAVGRALEATGWKSGT